MKDENVDCMKCKYYYVTWDVSFPKGCKLFGFKTRNLPDALVYESTGSHCTNFEKKAPPKK